MDPKTLLELSEAAESALTNLKSALAGARVEADRALRLAEFEQGDRALVGDGLYRASANTKDASRVAEHIWHAFSNTDKSLTILTEYVNHSLQMLP